MGEDTKTAASDWHNSNQFKLLLLLLMVIQNSSVVLIGRHTRSSMPKDQLYIVSHFIIVAEALKMVFSGILEQAFYKPLHKSLHDHVFSRPMDFLRILIPALLYLVQNSLLYIALSNLSAPLFQVCYQAKLLTTAVVSVIMLQRRYSVKQWICLTTLGLGVAIVVLGEKKAAETDTTNTHQNLFVGLVAVTISCFSSALAGVYFEKVIKKPGAEPNPPSVWMRNVQLAFFSVVIAISQFFYQQKSVPEEQIKPFMFGFNYWVWILVLLQAGGGLLVAAIIKYADNVLKGLATGVAVVVSTLGSMVFFDTPLSLQFAFGATMILSSVYLFSNDAPKIGAKTTKKTGDGIAIKAKSSDVEDGNGNVKDSGTVEMKPLVKE